MRTISGRNLSRVVLAFVSASLSAWPSLAAETPSPPDFSGIWRRDFSFFEQPASGRGAIIGRPRSGDGQPLIGDYTDPILKPQAAALLKQRGELSLKGGMIPDPVNLCTPEPTPFTMSAQDSAQILQHKDGVTLLYMGDHKVRHIRMNASHPPNLTPTWQGDSVGHYEGDTLVIDTIGQKAGPLSMVDLFGTPFSPALHVVERYRLIDGVAARDAMQKHQSRYFRPGQTSLVMGLGRGIDPDTTKKGLQIEITVEDPGVFNTPWSGFITYRPSTEGWSEVACAEQIYKELEAVVPHADRPDF